jgi:hypothetical protein
MALASDAAIYDQSTNDLEVPRPFIKKQILYQNDQNNSNYSGQIQIDCSSLSNSGQWLNYREAYLEIPFMVNMKSTVDITAAVNEFSIGLKNGYYQLLESMSVDLNQKNIVQLQQNLNMLVNYKVLTSFSADDLIKLGPIIGVGPDTPNSYGYSATAGLNGRGYYNNTFTPSNTIIEAADNITSRVQNVGGYNRLLSTTAVKKDTTTQLNKANEFFSTEARSYYTEDNNATAADKVYTWIVVATIRLKDICDWFNHVPLMKGANYRFVINYNSCIMTLTTATGASVTTTSYTQLSGNTCPIMFASGDTGNPNNLIIAAANQVISIACGVVKTSIVPVGVTSPFQTCRLYVPAYGIDPTHELNLIQEMPITRIEYNDFFTYRVLNIGGKGSFNVILTNGIPNPKYLVMIPFATSVNSGVTQPPYQSVFDSAPGTTCPNASITQFNIQLGGENVFNLDQQFNFSNFLDEFEHINALNGGQNTGLNSGIITSFAWQSAYRFYVADLSRRLSPEDKVPKSILVRGYNNTATTMDYVCFVVYGRSCTVRTISGEIVE